MDFSTVFCLVCWGMTAIVNGMATVYSFKIDKVSGIANAILTILCSLVFISYLFKLNVVQ